MKTVVSNPQANSDITYAQAYDEKLYNVDEHHAEAKQCRNCSNNVH